MIAGCVYSAFDEADLPRNVKLLGYVDDLTLVYDAVDIGVNPVTSGGGSNVKVPEYFANRLPVITMASGARGIPARDGDGLLIRRLEAFLDAIRRLSTNESERAALAATAYELFTDELNWEHISSDLFDQLRARTD